MSENATPGQTRGQTPLSNIQESDPEIQQLRQQMHEELVDHIIPFWARKAQDRRRGGVFGLISEDGTPDEDAPKGCILHARVLWTLSAAYRVIHNDEGLDTMKRSASHFTAHFIDQEHGGVYWMIDAEGRPLDERKHVYAQAFAIYALVEYFRATGDQQSLDAATAIFTLVETHAYDALRGGYEEAFSREWTLLDDVRLSEVDANERRSANTHLHVLEAYTTLYQVWPDTRLRARLQSVIEIFLEHLIAPDGSHVVAFLTEDWQARSTKNSFGHDIETSWLLVDAALVVGDPALTARVQEAASRLADAVLTRGVDREHGGIFNESDEGRLDTDKEWWPQAEAIVGFLAEYQKSDRPAYLHAATGTWKFVRAHMRDQRNGEWRRRVSRDGSESRGGEKVGPWKCPYHNARACLEVMRRVGAVLPANDKGP